MRHEEERGRPKVQHREMLECLSSSIRVSVRGRASGRTLLTRSRGRFPRRGPRRLRLEDCYKTHDVRNRHLGKKTEKGVVESTYRSLSNDLVEAAIHVDSGAQTRKKWNLTLARNIKD